MKTLSRRERQIMEILKPRGKRRPARCKRRWRMPRRIAIRAMLRILEDKGQLQHTQDANRYVYRPVESPERARKTALRDVVSSLRKGWRCGG